MLRADFSRAATQRTRPDTNDIGATAVSASNVNALRKLKRYMGIPEAVTLWDKMTQVAVTDEETAARLQVDVGKVGPNAPPAPTMRQTSAWWAITTG